MLGLLKKYWLLYIILGAVLLALGIYMAVTKEFQIGKNGEFHFNFLELVSGVSLIVLGWFFSLPAAKKQRGGYRVLYLAEFVLVVAVAILGFLIPFISGFFGEDWNIISGIKKDLGFWFGIAVYLHGAVTLFIAAFSSSKTNHTKYFFTVGLLLVTLGCYLIFKNPASAEMLTKVISWSFIVIGAILLVIGVLIVVDNSKKNTKSPSKK